MFPTDLDKYSMDIPTLLEVTKQPFSLLQPSVGTGQDKTVQLVHSTDWPTNK